MKKYRILAINPGSTSTKVAVFEDEQALFSASIPHDSAKLAEFGEISDQFDYRKDAILEALVSQKIDLGAIDAFSGRGGGLVALEGGTYEINEIMLAHARACLTAKHPATLGCQLADYFAKQYGKRAFVVNPPDVDEFEEVARMTGVKGVYRESRIHALNQKEIGIRFAAAQNKRYEEMNLVIAHIGGGVSVTAHKKGRMVDSNDIVSGDGPMAPTRCGSLPVKSVIRMCSSGRYTERELLDLTSKNGGLMSLLGTADVLEVLKRIKNGDRKAELAMEAMIYQIVKAIGAQTAVLGGDVEAIILTGGIVHSDWISERIEEKVRFAAPVVRMAGEFEMEALSAGAIRVLQGEEAPKVYTGEPTWKGEV